MGNQILYFEDDVEIGDLVTKDLESRGYGVTWRVSSDQYPQFIKQADLIILDIMLPGLDGFTIGERIKAIRSDVPIIF